MEHDRDALVSPSEAAALFGVTPKTVRRWVTDGDLAAVKVGSSANSPVRIPMSEVVARLRAAGPGARDEGEPHDQ
jgi:excisionase family DNA binding protein